VEAKDKVLPCDLLITEFMAKVSSPVKGKRWVEIFNASGEEINMARVTIMIMKEGGKKPGEIELNKGGGVVLPPGQYLWVRIDADPLPEDLVQGLHVHDTDKNVALADNAFEMWLEAVDHTVIHKIRFGGKEDICDGKGLLPAVSVGSNQSVELQRPYFSCQASVTACDAWRPAQSGTVPGVEGATGTPGGPPPVTEGTLGLPNPVPGEVAVTEIMYRSSEANDSADWFELISLAGEPVSLGGCVIGDGTASGDHTISLPVALCPGDYVLLSNKDMPDVEEDYKFSTPNLNKTGDRLYLRSPDESGAMQSLFDIVFTSSGSYPMSKDQHGNASIQSCPAGTPDTLTAEDYLDPANWEVTTEGNVGNTLDLGTPGVQNSCKEQCICDPPCGPDEVCAEVDGGCECVAKPGTPAPGDLVATEFLSNSSGQCSGKDWVEILNVTSGYLSLKECTLADANNNPVTIDDDVLVGPGEYIVLLQGSADTAFDAPSYYGYGSSPNLDKGGDTFILACGGQTVVGIGYGSKGDLPKPGDKDGLRVAVQLRPPDGGGFPTPAFAADSTNWEAACVSSACGDFATPGVANAGCSEPAQCAPECANGFKCVAFQGDFECARFPGNAELAPTEYLSNSSDGCSGKDWFEVYNLTSDYLRLDGCTLADANGNPTAIAAARCVVPPKGYLALVQTSDDGLEFGAQNFCGYGSNPNLDKGGDTLAVACQGAELFSFSYGSKGSFPKPGDDAGKRVSAQLQPTWGDMGFDYALKAQNWNLSCKSSGCGDKATPGAANDDCPF